MDGRKDVCAHDQFLFLSSQIGFSSFSDTKKLQKDQEAATLNIANTEFNNVAQVSSKPETFLVS